MVGTQAVFNVLTGERYKMIPKEIKEYVKGLYGASPAPIGEEIRKKIIGDEEVVTVRPADLLQPEIEKYRTEIGDLATSTEDLLSYILFPQVAKKFFENRLYGEATVCDDSKEKVHHIYVTM
jgi:oxaloacetate decarboxylase alpha subunit